MDLDGNDEEWPKWQIAYDTVMEGTWQTIDFPRTQERVYEILSAKISLRKKFNLVEHYCSHAMVQVPRRPAIILAPKADEMLKWFIVEVKHQQSYEALNFQFRNPNVFGKPPPTLAEIAEAEKEAAAARVSDFIRDLSPPAVPLTLDEENQAELDDYTDSAKFYGPTVEPGVPTSMLDNLIPVADDWDEPRRLCHAFLTELYQTEEITPELRDRAEKLRPTWERYSPDVRVEEMLDQTIKWRGLNVDAKSLRYRLGLTSKDPDDAEEEVHTVSTNMAMSRMEGWCLTHGKEGSDWYKDAEDDEVEHKLDEVREYVRCTNFTLSPAKKIKLAEAARYLAKVYIGYAVNTNAFFLWEQYFNYSYQPTAYLLQLAANRQIEVFPEGRVYQDPEDVEPPKPKRARRKANAGMSDEVNDNSDDSGLGSVADSGGFFTI